MNTYPIPYKSNIAVAILDYLDTKDDNEWQLYYNFHAIQIPQEIMQKDPVLASLMQSISFRAGVLRMDPYTCYNWHVDTKRLVGINMLLTGFTSSDCLFAPTAKASDVVFPFMHHNYDPNTYYIFNTQLPHTVLNYGGQRLLFSIEFTGDDVGITFNQLVALYEPIDGESNDSMAAN